MVPPPHPRPPRAARFASAAALAILAACSEPPEPPPADATGETDLPELADALARYDGVARPDVNVLLISLDSVRRDYVSCYGHRPARAPDQPTTPHIDALAADGVVLEDHYTNTSWTLPSHVTLMTGQPDLVHGVDLDDFALHSSLPTIAAVLHRLGYATAGFYSGTYLHERFGFARGFEEYRASYGPVMAKVLAERRRRQARADEIYRSGEASDMAAVQAELHQVDVQANNFSHKDRSSAIVTDHALRAIERAEAGGRPWFVFAHYFDPHYDYIPPRELARRFDPDYRGDINGKRYFHNPRIGTIRRNDPSPTLRDRAISERDLDHIKALYEGDIAWTDAEIGRLLQGLRDRGTLDRTLVIVTSDHGEEFFEHGGIGHRGTLLEEQLRVPCVLRLPGTLPAGKRVRGLTSHADLFPTILELLGVPALDGLFAQSIVPLIDGRDGGADRHVLGRLVQKHNFAAIGGGQVARVTVREVFLWDTIKVFRFRRWPEPLPGCPDDRAEKLREYAAEARQKDLVLQWIDLARTPGEQEQDFRTDFDDPRAAAALQRFQRVYEDLLARPRPVTLSIGRASERVMRSRPGFAEAVADMQADFLLPPPGK